MKTIRKRISRLVFADSLIITLPVILIFNKTVVNTVYISLIFLTAGILFLVLSGFLAREYRIYKDARLIMENEIMNIEIAKIEDENFKTDNRIMLTEGICAHISCFGIVIGSKVIKFNADGITLKNIEIEREYISFVYGTNGKERILRILHGVINQHKLEEFIKRINHETGVMPQVIE